MRRFALALCCLLTACGGDPGTLLVEQMVDTDAAAVQVDLDAATRLELPPGILDAATTLRVVEHTAADPLGGDEPWQRTVAITLDGQQAFDGYLLVHCAPPADPTPGAMLQAMASDDDGATWRPVATLVDPLSGAGVIATDHCTLFAWRWTDATVPALPTAEIAAVTWSCWRRITDSGVRSMLEGYDGGWVAERASDDQLRAVWGCTSEAFAFGSNVLGPFMEHGLDMPWMTSLNEAALHVGIGLALVQAAMDFQSGKTEKAVFDLTKTALNTVLGKMVNTRVFSLAMIGVFAVDYALTAFANEAWAGRRELYRAGFDRWLSLQRQEGFNLRWWRRAIRERMRAAEPAGFEQVVEDLIRERIAAFWADAEERALIQAEIQGHGWTFDGGYNEERLRPDLDSEFRGYLLLYIRPLLERLQRDYLQAARDAQLRRLQEMAGTLNARRQLVVSVDAPGRDPASLAGLVVRLPVQRSDSEKAWAPVLAGDASLTMPFTLAGAMASGLGSEAELLLPDGPVRAPIEMDETGARIRFQLEPPAAGVWVRLAVERHPGQAGFNHATWQALPGPGGVRSIGARTITVDPFTLDCAPADAGFITTLAWDGRWYLPEGTADARITVQAERAWSPWPPPERLEPGQVLAIDETVTMTCPHPLHLSRRQHRGLPPWWALSVVEADGAFVPRADGAFEATAIELEHLRDTTLTVIGQRRITVPADPAPGDRFRIDLIARDQADGTGTPYADHRMEARATAWYEFRP